MPSIAQQDYIVIAPKVGGEIIVDAYALGQLAKIIEKRDMSIFDVILKNPAIFEENEPNYGRVLGVNPSNPRSLGFFDNGNNEVTFFSFPYTSTQYEGLAAVQEAGKAGGELVEHLPTLVLDGGKLYESFTRNAIADLEGHNISITIAAGKLATVAISEETEPDGIKVPFEEIKKLIGLPIEVKQQG
ncbi:hypothetical protein [Selenomonas ruminantium]|uniref:hypothetical protein n=1 Tax=Selenomonas ruminantium TaxID=971 RepID=UPI0026EAE85C|nr:hypothetical protein [Selenomonas ruminantium]